MEFECTKCKAILPESKFRKRNNAGKRRKDCVDCEKAYFAVRYINKKNIIRDKARLSNKQNPIKNRDRVRQWSIENPGAVKEKNRRYYLRHKEDVIKKNIARNAVYRQQNPEKVAIWRKKDKSKLNTRISDNLRARFRAAIKNNYKSGSAVKDLGCSIEDFKIYLESLWQPGMTWDNYGIFGWHIDHKMPLSAFDLNDREQVIKACNYTNLQPLWAKDNLSKSKRF